MFGASECGLSFACVGLRTLPLRRKRLPPDSLADQLVDAVKTYGLPFIRSNVPLPTLLETMHSTRFGNPWNREYGIPVALYLLGRNSEADAFLSEELIKVGSGTDPCIPTLPDVCQPSSSGDDETRPLVLIDLNPTMIICSSKGANGRLLWKTLQMRLAWSLAVAISMAPQTIAQANNNGSEFSPNVTLSEKTWALNLKRKAEGGSAEAQSNSAGHI